MFQVLGRILSWIFGPGLLAANRDGGGRPEAVRRTTLGSTGRLILIGSAMGLPFSLYLLRDGMVLPFVLNILGLAAGLISVALHRQGRYEAVAATQAYGTLMTGTLLAVADPAIVDFGLAVALLGPVHASLLSRSATKHLCWLGLGGAVILALVSAAGVPLWPEAPRAAYGWLAGIAFLATALIVLFAANRLNAVFQVFEKAQIRAYRHLIEHVQDAVIRFSSDGTLLHASRSSEALFGCHRYELAKSGFIDRMHVLDRPQYLTAFSQANRSGRSTTVEVRMRRDNPGGTATVPQYVWVEVALSPVVDENAREDRYEVIALLRDVTERKDQEQEMRRARKLAEEASMAKSRFLATIGHELRTPLNAIVGFSEMMTSGVVGELSPVHKEYATLIHRSGNHLIEVVRMLLDMSRIEAGKFELQAEPFQPDALVGPSLQMVAQMADEKKVRIVADLPRSLPMIVADERACRQILINLLSNAVKFSNPGTKVTLSIRRQGTHLALSVADQGIGMEAEVLNRLGEPFFQAQEGLSRGYEGTGLGLSIVKGLVDLHEGTLRATSTPGQGTTITVLLPVNGPATKVEETEPVTPIRREPAVPQMSEWQDERRKAL